MNETGNLITNANALSEIPSSIYTIPDDSLSNNASISKQYNLRESNEISYPSLPTSSKKPTTTAEWLLSNQFKKGLMEILPKNLTPDRICRIALTELRKNPRLQECSAQSFLGAVINATVLGLEIGDVLGHVYLIPRKGMCQMHLGYKGMIELAKRAGVLVTSNLVYPGDEFYAEYGNEERLKHIIKSHHNTNYISVYAYIRTKDDKFKMEIMTPEDINRIRNRSPSGNKPDSPWVNDFNAMAKKTVVRQLFKYMPISNELTKAVALDEQAEIGIQENNFQLEEE